MGGFWLRWRRSNEWLPEMKLNPDTSIGFIEARQARRMQEWESRNKSFHSKFGLCTPIDLVLWWELALPHTDRLVLVVGWRWRKTFIKFLFYNHFHLDINPTTVTENLFTCVRGSQSPSLSLSATFLAVRQTALWRNSVRERDYPVELLKIWLAQIQFHLYMSIYR